MPSAQWYMVYDSETGRAVSVGTQVSPALPQGLAVAALPEPDAAAFLAGDGVWDEATRAVVILQPPVPDATPWQIRTWLHRHGVSLSQVEALLASLPEAVRYQAQIDWEWASIVRRSHPLMDSLGGALGLSPEQIDAAFREAAEYQ